jgi:predicted molibdopterin-dependent oxidoreductase YjgC
LVATFGAGGSTTSYEEFENADLIICWGSNTMECHPIIYNHMRRGIKNGAKMVVVDPRKIDQVKKADKWLPVNVGTDICLANAMANVIIEEDLYNKKFVERATENFEALKEKVAGYTPEYAEQITGVPAGDIREVARMYATAEKATLNWTLGITEHHNGADAVFALINLGLLTGHIGKYGSGLNPLRGQNNVQGGGDMGALPDKMVGGWLWNDPEAHELFEEVWGTALPEKVGKNQAQMLDAIRAGEIRCMYVIGENPCQSDADEHKSDQLFSGLDLLVVQDLFLTKTARMADVVLPAAASWCETEGTFVNSERRVQRVRKVVEPPGEARPDEFILRDIANRMGAGWGFETAEDIWNEVRRLAPKFSGISYERLEKYGGIQWPCLDGSFEEISDITPKEQLAASLKGAETSEGTTLTTDVVEKPQVGTKFLHAQLWAEEVQKRAPFHPVDHEGPVEMPDEEYPFQLTTGRRLAFYNTGTMTLSYKKVKDPEELLEICEEDAEVLGIEDGAFVKVSSRRGTVPAVKARVTDRVRPGLLFMGFSFSDQVPTNVLTINAVDPKSGTAELKACAVKLEPAD